MKKPGKKRCKEVFLLPVSRAERRLPAIKSVLVMVLLNYFFYRSLWAFIPLLAVGGLYYQMEETALYRRKKEAAREQFKELLLLVSTGQRAGFSAENAFLSGYEDMKELYGKDSSVCRMLQILKSGRENNTAFSELWRQIGDRLDIAEIKEFAQVYEISQESSGNMAAIMEKTADIIICKIEAEKEIGVLLSERRLEQKIMNLMPFLIMLYITITSPGYFNGLYSSFGGVLLMSAALAVYVLAYMLSVRMISAEKLLS